MPLNEKKDIKKVSSLKGSLICKFQEGASLLLSLFLLERVSEDERG